MNKNGNARTRLLSASDVADETGFCREYVVRLIHMGKIRAIKLGNSWRIRENDLQDFIDGKQAAIAEV